MEVILLERIRHLGQMGDVVNVKPGYARNFLLPQGKALRASKGNIARFEEQKSHLEAQNLEARKEAENLGVGMQGVRVTLIRQASETGHLFGSVSTRDIAAAISNEGHVVTHRQVILDHPIKTLGIYEVLVHLHPEVEIAVSVNVARSEQEAEAQLSSEAEVFETEELAAQAEEELSEDEAGEEEE
jgi:large subunit ribosomal protein L9